MVAVRWGITHDCAEKLVDLTRSFLARVVYLGNAAASGGQHFVARQSMPVERVS